MLRMILVILVIASFIACDFERPFANDAIVTDISTTFKSGDTTYTIDGNNLTATMTDANTIVLFGNNKQNPVATVTLNTISKHTCLLYTSPSPRD